MNNYNRKNKNHKAAPEKTQRTRSDDVQRTRQENAQRAKPDDVQHTRQENIQRVKPDDVQRTRQENVQSAKPDNDNIDNGDTDTSLNNVKRPVESYGTVILRLPKSLYHDLAAKAEEELISINKYIIYILSKE